MDKDGRTRNAGVPVLLQPELDKIPAMATLTIVRRKFGSQQPAKIASMQRAELYDLIEDQAWCAPNP